jgi:tRNA pseudouridine38-40 synthase
LPPSSPFRYRLTVGYVGTEFGGWQRQPNATTVQERLEAAISELVGERVEATGAGRTDAGVHARGQVAHVDLGREFPLGGLVHGANHRLPGSIRVLAAEPAPADFHARFSAVAKEYAYRFVEARPLDPFVEPFALAVPEGMDRRSLGAAVLHLPGRHDFAAFALAGGAHTTTVRTIFSARLEVAGPALTLRLVGDGFLRGMVRGLAGTLLDVALGRRTVAGFAALLAGDSRAAAGATAPAHGLTLERVYYAAPGCAASAVVASNE